MAGTSSPASKGADGDNSDSDSVEEIYRALQRGAGRERVTDANVAELVQMAGQRGDAQLEFLLREWRSPCGDDPALPGLAAQLPANPPPR